MELLEIIRATGKIIRAAEKHSGQTWASMLPKPLCRIRLLWVMLIAAPLGLGALAKTGSQVESIGNSRAS